MEMQYTTNFLGIKINLIHYKNHSGEKKESIIRLRNLSFLQPVTI